MKLAFPELTWLEPPSRGKLINELRHGGPVYEKAVYLPRTHPIYTTATSVNPWRRGKSYFSPTRQAGLLDGRAVVASYQMRGRRGQFSGTPPLAAADSNDAAPTAYQPTFFFCGDQR
jgi:hypothetical protein